MQVSCDRFTINNLKRFENPTNKVDLPLNSDTILSNTTNTSNMKHKALAMDSSFFEEVIDKDWSKRIIDKLYSKNLDATKFEQTLWAIKSYFMKNEYWKAVKSIKDSTIDEIIDDVLARSGNMPQECYNEDKETTMWTFSDVGEFKEIKEGDRVEIQIMRTGKWDHPIYGKVIITPETLDDVVENFNNNTRGVELAVDENHEPNHKALGWYKELKRVGKNALNASIEVTKMGADLLNQ